MKNSITAAILAGTFVLQGVAAAQTGAGGQPAFAPGAQSPGAQQGAVPGMNPGQQGGQHTVQGMTPGVPAGMPVAPPPFGPGEVVNRMGTTTAAEGGAFVAGPLGEPMRVPGPATAVFGATLFTRGVVQSSETPNPNYIIVPGDRVSISVWGFVEAATVTQVDTEGNIFVPQIGPVRLAGARAGDLQRVVEAEVRRIYTQQVQVYAVLLSVGRIGAFVTGFVRGPGRHIGAGQDSVLEYLARAGGVDPARGSYRDIAINRGGRTVARIDLYRFLLNGELPRMTLQENDTIVVPPQGALVGADGAVRNNYLFEVAGRSMAGAELIRLASPLPAATNVAIRGTRQGRPFARYVTIRELAGMQLMDQDVVTFITDAPAQTVRVMVEGSRIGPSVLITDRTTSLCSVLDHVAVEPELANTRAVFLLRPSLAAQQMRIINEAMDRLERQLFMNISPTTGVANVRASEANLVASYIGRARRTQPEGRLVVMDRGGRCADVRLEDGDTIVIPERVQTVLVAGEVQAPQAVVWRPGMTIRDYIARAGGTAARGSTDQVMIRKASGELVLEPTEPPDPGDELIVLPVLDPKNFQLTTDLLNLIYQTALSARVFAR